MTEITKMPADTPSTNALKSIPDDLLGPIPAEIKLGQAVLMVMEKPPEVRDTITVVMRLKVKDAGVAEAGEGGEELTHYRKVKVVAAWIKGDPEPPNPEDEQPPMFDDEGEVSDEARGDDYGDEPGIVRPTDSGVEVPGFSHVETH